MSLNVWVDVCCMYKNESKRKHNCFLYSQHLHINHLYNSVTRACILDNVVAINVIFGKNYGVVINKGGQSRSKNLSLLGDNGTDS